MDIEHPNPNLNFQIGCNTMVLNVFVRALRFVSLSKFSRSVVLEKSPTEVKNRPDLDAITWLCFSGSVFISILSLVTKLSTYLHVIILDIYFFIDPNHLSLENVPSLHSTNESGFPNISVN